MAGAAILILFLVAIFNILPTIALNHRTKFRANQPRTEL